MITSVDGASNSSPEFASGLFLNASHHHHHHRDIVGIAMIVLFVFAFILFGLRSTPRRCHRSTSVQSSVREFLLIGRLSISMVRH